MLQFFRSISRGRRKGDAENTASFSSPSPERSRRHQLVRSISYADDDRGRQDEGDEYSPRRPLPRPQDYFEANHYQASDEDAEEEVIQNEDGEGGEDAEEAPLLPIFSSAHLDKLPLYNITHAIRQLIVARCETTLSWDQLRSPQISQFLVKPIQSQIRTDHFNRATLCALIANCLQFQKEGQQNPGMIGVSRTRAAISELLAMRLLREYSTRELIDSLSYDFDPLQGMVAATTPGSRVQANRTPARVARVSTIEIAIRAEAKRFLAHPLVVQHLEAIWSGNIVFHSEADNLHRQNHRSGHSLRGKMGNYGTAASYPPSAPPADSVLSRKAQVSKFNERQIAMHVTRRAVTLYNPKEASLFKLSRLRVPRYRQVFSTLSFATMLALFVAVLVDRSMTITPLEVVFWFWSLGYMLDEIVGFTEQGFGLYILSFWNAFDLGILVLFGIYYCLRLYGIVLAEEGKHKIAGVAYDVLAATAILLFPRLFSVLDHYKYFSQLLIAFRLMALDLMAVLVLIVISCSGFFVALSLSFSDQRDANGVAYSLFQILMGFTPAVWDHWQGYSLLGRAIMVIFLTICHFLVVTILITVLTNSFMAIVKNAEEEHQFLFAVNTISMVKSDALFSYVAPTNIFGWMLSPLRYLIPLRTYVKFNRTIIKISHFPILFAIFAYERTVMARNAFVPIELVEKQSFQQSQPAAISGGKRTEIYNANSRLREPSVISFNKDRALDEVFRYPFQGDTMRTTTQNMDVDRRKSTAVDHWMQAAEIEGGASPPLEEPRSVLERLENRRPKTRHAVTSSIQRRLTKPSREFSVATRSVASDPDLISLSASRRPHRIEEEPENLESSTGTLPHDTEADGDDEINEESDGNGTPAIGESALSIERAMADGSESEVFQTPTGPNSPLLKLSHAAQVRSAYSPHNNRAVVTANHAQANHRQQHSRQTSSGTILFNPQQVTVAANPFKQPLSRSADGKKISPRGILASASREARVDRVSGPSAARLLHRNATGAPKTRPIMPPRQKTAPIVPGGGLTFLDMPPTRRRDPSFNARALDLASDLGDNKFGPSPGGIDAGGISGFPASFSEQMMRERDFERRQEEDRRRTEDEEKGMVNRIMLARMHTLEEGFREVLKEIKDLSQTANNSSRRESEGDSSVLPIRMATKSQRMKMDPGNPQDGTVPSSWQGPKTPIGRIGGNEKSKKSSPRKVLRKNSKRDQENGVHRGSSASNLVNATSLSASSEMHFHEDFHETSQEAQHRTGAAMPESVDSVAAALSGYATTSNKQEPANRPTTAIQDDGLEYLKIQNGDHRQPK